MATISNRIASGKSSLQNYLLPSLTGRGRVVGLFLLLLLTWGCSTNDDDEKEDAGHATKNFVASDGIPYWVVNQQADQQRPQWESPDPSQFENKMIVMLRLQDELVPFSTDDDLMAVMNGDECRALSQRSGNDEKVFFVINVHGNSTVEANNYRLCYYSGGLRQLFEINTPPNTFHNERNLGIDSDFSPDFTVGSTKYSVKTQLTVSPGMIEAIDADWDLVGVFVDGECRGVGYPDQPFTVFSYTTSEQAELRYFSSKEQGIFTSTQKVMLTGEPQSYAFEF